MSREFPDWINPWTAAQGRRRFGGTVPLERMKRLARLIEPDQSAGGNQAAFETRFHLDDDRRPVIEIEVEAELALMCQASLEPYIESLRRRSTLGVIEEEAEVEVLPGHYDPVLADNGRLALVTLVEDELILALPQVPRNPAVQAVSYSTGKMEEEVAQERPNPFAELKDKLGSG